MIFADRMLQVKCYIYNLFVYKMLQIGGCCRKHEGEKRGRNVARALRGVQVPPRAAAPELTYY